MREPTLEDRTTRILQHVYRETREYYDRHQIALEQRGFRILYGPPIHNARYLFLGFQPGGETSEAETGQHDSWGDESWYLTAKLRKDVLARKIREAFEVTSANHVGLNAVFFRSPNMKRWHEVACHAELERFSICKAKTIVRTLEPQNVIVIGFGTAQRLCPEWKTETVRISKRGTRLITEGSLWGCPAYAIPHLSGARVGATDLRTLKEFFQARG